MPSLKHYVQTAGGESHSIFPCGHVFLKNLLNNIHGCNQMLPKDRYDIINHEKQLVCHPSSARIVLSHTHAIPLG